MRSGSARRLLGVRLGRVDHVPTERGEFDAVDDLGGLGAGLGELPRDTPGTQDGLAGDQAERPGEQVQDGDLAGDVLGGAVLRVLGAVTGLHDQGLTGGDLAEQGAHGGHVVGLYEGGAGGERLADPAQLEQVAPLGLLQRLTDTDVPGDVLHDFVHADLRSSGVVVRARGRHQVGIPVRLISGTGMPRARSCWNGFMNSRWRLIFPSSNSKECRKWFS